MSIAHAYAAPTTSAPLIPITIDRREVGPNDVLIDIEFCGVCHSDIHLARGEFGPTPKNLVPRPRNRWNRHRDRIRRHQTPHR